MKANELRINNYLEYFMEDFENPWRVTQVDIDDIAYFVQYPNDTDYRPIPLTEEWLLKFGFKMFNGFDDAIIWIKDDVELEYVTRNSTTAYLNYINRECNHVHQLQNLYFALTGEELTINTDNHDTTGKD